MDSNIEMMVKAQEEGIQIKTTINKLISDFEEKYKNIGAIIVPITSDHIAFDKENPDRVQFLGLSFLLKN